MGPYSSVMSREWEPGVWFVAGFAVGCLAKAGLLWVLTRLHEDQPPSAHIGVKNSHAV